MTLKSLSTVKLTAHADVFEQLTEYIVVFVVNKKWSEFATSIYNHYKMILLEQGIDDSPYKYYTITYWEISWDIQPVSSE